MTGSRRGRRAAEGVHRHYRDRRPEADSLGALAACGAPAEPERLHAAVRAYAGFARSLGALLEPAPAGGADGPRWRPPPPLTQTPPPGPRVRHVF